MRRAEPPGPRPIVTDSRDKLHAFLTSLPASRFPALTILGDYIWADDRDDRFATSIHTLIIGLQALPPPTS